MKTLPRIVDDRVSLVLTPQAYHNYDPATDIFNHSASAYWSMMVPGEDAWGHIVCTGRALLMIMSALLEPFWSYCLQLWTPTVTLGNRLQCNLA